MTYLDPAIEHVVQLSYHVAGKMPGGNPVLTANLLIGTAGRESCCVYRSQLGGGPARGLWQMEPDTAWWLAKEYLQERLRTAQTVSLLLAAGLPVFRDDLFGVVNKDRLMFAITHNDLLACVMARLKYLSIPEKVPDTLERQAQYWKTHYNGAHTRGLQAEDYTEKWFEMFGSGTRVKESLI